MLFYYLVLCGNYGYVFSRDASSAGTSTTGAREGKMVTYVYDVGRNAATYTDKALATNEGFTLNYTGGSTTWKQVILTMVLL